MKRQITSLCVNLTASNEKEGFWCFCHWMWILDSHTSLKYDSSCAKCKCFCIVSMYNTEREREKERERDILLIKLFVRSPSLVRFDLISFGLLGHTLSKRTDLCRTNVSPHLVECVGPLIMADGDNGAKAVSQ